MSRNPYQHPMDEPEIDATPRVSALAVSSLVFGLLCCIPVSGLIGTILGGAALVRIAKSDGRLSGRGLAFIGLVLGLLGTMFYLAFGAGTVWFFKQAGQFVQPVQALVQGDIDKARQQLTSTAAAKVTDERARAFADELKAEVGAPQRMPKGIGEWISGYGQVGQMIQGAQASAPRDSSAIPLPVYFEKDLALVMIYADPGQTGPTGLPLFRNVSVHTRSGKVIWLIPPDSGP